MLDSARSLTGARYAGRPDLGGLCSRRHRRPEGCAALGGKGKAPLGAAGPGPADIVGLTDVPVIFLSAYGREEIIAKALESGAIDYMVKPFSPTELVARVRGACAGRWPGRGMTRPAPSCWGT